MIEAIEPLRETRPIFWAKKEWGKRECETCASGRQLQIVIHRDILTIQRYACDFDGRCPLNV
jgi:hypothetical protein